MAEVKEVAAKAKETVKEVATKATAVAKDTAKAAETKAKETAKTAEAKAKETAKTAEAKAKKTTAAAKTTAKKTVAKAAAKTSTVKSTIAVQYQNNEVDIAKVEEMVKAQFISEGHKASSIKKVNIYVKPEEYSAYYVINDKFCGRVDIF